MSVPVDYTINKIVDEIYKEFNGTVPKETIFNIINFQSYTIKKGIEDGDNSHSYWEEEQEKKEVANA